MSKTDPQELAWRRDERKRLKESCVVILKDSGYARGLGKVVSVILCKTNPKEACYVTTEDGSTFLVNEQLGSVEM